jgi:predicted GIY-YIG superfamily endonuclease
MLGMDGYDYVTSPVYFDEMVKMDGELRGLIISERSVRTAASKNIPFAKGPTLYFLRDDGNIVYIGQTHVLPSRIAAHQEDKTFNTVSSFRTPESELIITEAMNIFSYRPILNKDVMNNEAYFKQVLKRGEFH